MNSRVQLLYYGLWVSQPILQLVVIGIMLRNKLRSKFKVFFAYILFQVLMSAVLLPISLKVTFQSARFYEDYFYSYWIAAAVSLVLGFMVIHEIFVDVFTPYHTLKDLGTILFKWAGLVMLLAAGVVAAASASTLEGPLVEAVLTVQRCIRVAQVGLILFLLLFSKYLGVSWKQRSFGIALGFGTYALVELFSAALRASAYISEQTSNFSIMVACNLAIVTWIRYTWARQIAREAPATLLKSQRWEESLTDLQHPASADSLIPMFEGMVDRALTRTEDEFSDQNTGSSEREKFLTPSRR